MIAQIVVKMADGGGFDWLQAISILAPVLFGLFGLVFGWWQWKATRADQRAAHAEELQREQQRHEREIEKLQLAHHSEIERSRIEALLPALKDALGHLSTLPAIAKDYANVADTLTTSTGTDMVATLFGENRNDLDTQIRGIQAVLLDAAPELITHGSVAIANDIRSLVDTLAHRLSLDLSLRLTRPEGDLAELSRTQWQAWAKEASDQAQALLTALLEVLGSQQKP